MATIDISRSHSLPIEEAKKRAEELAKGMEQKLGLVWKWEGDKIDFHAPSGAAKGAKGSVSVSTISASVRSPASSRRYRSMMRISTTVIVS